jgi:putative membrane-bound dehydrogenase-like protein
MPRTLSLALLFLLTATLPAQKEFGFDNRKPSGQPYLKPAESVARMKVADGFEVKLFAAEPQVINPIAMTVDEKGRVWVVECYEYPKRTAKGKMTRDRILILEDTKGDGVCDKVTVFAEGKDFPVPFDLASGIEVGNGGVYLGAPPYLFFIENKNDKAGKIDILLKGFGSQDTHETLNTFQWGPDGKLYGLHGVFTHSEVTPGQGDGPTTRLNAAVWRYDPRSKKFETFAEGTSNPWGMDWRNTDGQFILCCCVIPHLFHMSPGGNYKRQGGQSFNPYVYGEIKEICDHTFHKESGWAHAGLISLDTPLMPPEYRDSVIFGSIHGCSIKRNVLKRNGSTYTASRADDFLVSGDKNFRPINLRWGPNGEIYCIDWHDQNPCHQAAPDSWDYEHGRVYRLQTRGLTTKKAEDIGKADTAELIRIAQFDPNPYRARTARRLLNERRPVDARFPSIARGRLGLQTLWTMQAAGVLDWNKDLAGLGGDLVYNDDPAVRGGIIRLASENKEKWTAKDLDALIERARADQEPSVRLELASAALRLAEKNDVSALLRALMEHKEDAKDPVIPQMLWLAYEKQLSKERADLDWLRDNAAGNPLVTDTIVPRTMRRLAATGKPADLDACIAFIGDLKDVAVRRKALEGLTLALAGKQIDAPASWAKVYAALQKDDDAEVRRFAQSLAVTFRDLSAARKALAAARDVKRPARERIEAVREVGLAKLLEGRQPLLDLLASEKDTELRLEIVRALSGFDGPEVAAGILKGWKDYPPPLRSEAVNALAGRKDWAGALLDAVGDKRVPRTDLTDNTILRIRAFKDKKLDDRIQAVWGQFRDTPPDLNAIIDKMRADLYTGPASFERGRKVFEANCLKCHQFEGRGHEVGPNLDGAGRDIEYILVNVLDPNRVIGAPYFQRFIALKNGKVETGLLAAEDADSVTLKGENAALKVILKKDIESSETKQISLMPEGLQKNMSMQDFRDLVRYLMAHPFLTAVEVSQPLAPTATPDDVAGAKWTQPLVGVPGRIPLPAAKEKVAVFVRAEVNAPQGMKTRLLLGANGPAKVWLNGRLVYDGQPGNGPVQPDQTGVEVELRQGGNVLLLQTTYQGDKEAVYARLLDPDRKLRYPEPKE